MLQMLANLPKEKKKQLFSWGGDTIPTQFCSVALSCQTLCNPMDCNTPGFPVHHQLPSLLKLISMELVMPSDHLILCRPLLFLPSIFSSIRVFSNDSALCIRWQKYCSFNFSISPSNEYSGLISIGIDWWISLRVKDSQECSLIPQYKSISSLALSFFFIVQL